MIPEFLQPEPGAHDGAGLVGRRPACVVARHAAEGTRGHRALANSPGIILADEPTAARDSERARVVMARLRQLAREQGVAVLVVTQDEKIFDRFDRLVSLRDGRIEADERTCAAA